MAIDLKLRYLQTNFGTKTIYLEDFTGIYEANDNPGGYNSPNPSRDLADQDLTSWQLIVVRPDGTNWQWPNESPSLTNVNEDFINALEDASPNEVLQIPIIETEDSIQNGEWTFTLNAGETGDADAFTTTITQYIYNLKPLEDLIFAKFASEVDFCEYPDCACNKSLLVIWTYYMALKSAIEEQNTVQADYLSTVLTTLTS